MGNLRLLHSPYAAEARARNGMQKKAKYFFNKSKLFERVMPVTMINLVLFDFACKFTKNVTTNIFTWPRIKHGEGTYSTIQ